MKPIRFSSIREACCVLSVLPIILVLVGAFTMSEAKRTLCDCSQISDLIHNSTAVCQMGTNCSEIDTTIVGISCAHTFFSKDSCVQEYFLKTPYGLLGVAPDMCIPNFNQTVLVRSKTERDNTGYGIGIALVVLAPIVCICLASWCAYDIYKEQVTEEETNQVQDI